MENGMPFAQLTGHIAEVTSLAFSPDGQNLASGSYDNTVQYGKVRKELWNT
jgi:WD40 repeat protein